MPLTALNVSTTKPLQTRQAASTNRAASNNLRQAFVMGAEVLDFSSRRIRPELLDSGCMPEQEVSRTLSDMRRINGIFGSRRILLQTIATEVTRRRLPRFNMLDVAAASCDLPVAILNWAERKGLEAQVFALDYRQSHLALFRNELAGYQRLHRVCADALYGPIRDHSFDFVTCCNFFHHLEEPRAIELLLAMKRWAREAVIVSDLERHWFPYHFFRLVSPFLSTTRMTEIDGAVSIAQGFRKPELERIAKAAQLADFRVQRCWPFRLVVVGNPSAAA